MSEEEMNKLYHLMKNNFPHLMSETDQRLTERPIGSMKGMLIYMADDKLTD